MGSCAHGRQALSAAAAVGRGPRVYEKRDPFAQALHQVVRENLATFYAAIEEGWQTGLPDFVRAEFAGYLDCSVMQRGFAHLACEDCGLPRLVAFTCAGRGFCPTCLGRWMNQTTHNLLRWKRNRDAQCSPESELPHGADLLFLGFRLRCHWT